MSYSIVYVYSQCLIQCQTHRSRHQAHLSSELGIFKELNELNICFGGSETQGTAQERWLHDDWDPEWKTRTLGAGIVCRLIHSHVQCLMLVPPCVASPCGLASRQGNLKLYTVFWIKPRNQESERISYGPPNVFLFGQNVPLKSLSRSHTGIIMGKKQRKKEVYSHNVLWLLGPENLYG